MAAATAAMQQLPVEQLNELCLAPFEFERTRGYEEAMKAHDLAISRLLAIANDLTKDKDSKDLASQRITFHQERKGYIKQVLDGKVPADSLLILPTLKGATKELQTCIPNTEGKSFISSDQYKIYQAKLDPEVKAQPEFQYLFQNSIPFYTPLLSPKLPITTYRIHKGTDKGFFKARLTGYRNQYYEVRDASDKHTLYTMRATGALNIQVQTTTLHRVTELSTTCIRVTISPIKTKVGYGILSTAAAESLMVGRPLQIQTQFPPDIIQEPTDRVEKMGWTPRRFTYGGRRFVWKQENSSWGDDWNVETLYEVEKEWPKRGSKTGKKEEKTLGRKLVWGTYKNGKNEVGTINFVGGIDQLFREYLLASQLTKFTVIRGFS